MPIEMQWPMHKFTGWYWRRCYEGRSAIDVEKFQELRVP